MGNKKQLFNDDSIIIKRIYTEKGKKPPHRIHVNDGYELYLLLEGDISFSIDGHMYKLAPYDLLLISNKEVQRTFVNSDLPYERMYIYFDVDLLNMFSTSSYSLLQELEECRKVFGNRIDHEIIRQNDIYNYFLEIYKWYRSTSPERQIMMVSILLQCLVRINTIYKADRNRESFLRRNEEYNEKIYAIIRYISMNLDKKITLEELEKRFYINRYHLCHLFKEITGFTVIEYVNYKKVLLAKEELQKGKAVSEVWGHLGFEDYSSFYRIFKKLSNLSPKQYLNNVLEKNKEKRRGEVG